MDHGIREPVVKCAQYLWRQRVLKTIGAPVTKPRGAVPSRKGLICEAVLAFATDRNGR